MTRLVPVVFVALAAALFCLPDTTTAQVPAYQPEGVSPGETYHLVFVTSTGTAAFNQDITYYNDFVQNEANASTLGLDMDTLSWTCVGSTITHKANGDPGPEPAEAWENAPVSGDVYTLDPNGVFNRQVSDESTASKFYQDPASFLNHLAPIVIDQNGNSQAGYYVWTGSDVDGTRMVPNALGWDGDYLVTNGDAQAVTASWINHATATPASSSYKLYGLSEPLIGYDPSGLAGDFDGDGDVDGQDFLLWQRDSGVGNLGDWESNFGTVTASAANSAAVPEPGAIVCLVVGLMAVIGVMRQKRPVCCGPVS